MTFTTSICADAKVSIPNQTKLKLKILEFPYQVNLLLNMVNLTEGQIESRFEMMCNQNLLQLTASRGGLNVTHLQSKAIKLGMTTYRNHKRVALISAMCDLILNQPSVSKCFNSLTLIDEDVDAYISEDVDNIVFLVLDGKKTTTDILCSTYKHLNSVIRDKSNLFYECEVIVRRKKHTCVPLMNNDRYINVALRDILMIEEKSLLQSIRSGFRKITVQSSGFSDRLQSHAVSNLKIGASVGGKHCQPGSGAILYIAASEGR
jgi:hypothetical protein